MEEIPRVTLILGFPSSPEVAMVKTLSSGIRTSGATSRLALTPSGYTASSRMVPRSTPDTNTGAPGTSPRASEKST